MTQTMPDHSWVRESQIHYTGRLDCPVCSETYVVQNDYSAPPSLVRREDVKKYEAAAARRQAVEREIATSEEAQRLIPRIVSAIDAQKSIAARHRALQHYRLSNESLGTYRRRPYGGGDAVRKASGKRLAEIGCDPEIGGEDKDYFLEMVEKLRELEAEEHALVVKPVRTDAKWMRM
ncbi:hypothetical protein ACULN0_04000 [Pectobacterium actinidiae]|uniref:hypothetical protein n=1 Tax=Pectobacterium actinidiae TaxID=1507808 RepID=UPI00404086C8